MLETIFEFIIFKDTVRITIKSESRVAASAIQTHQVQQLPLWDRMSRSQDSQRNGPLQELSCWTHSAKAGPWEVESTPLNAVSAKSSLAATRQFRIYRGSWLAKQLNSGCCDLWQSSCSRLCPMLLPSWKEAHVSFINAWLISYGNWQAANLTEGSGKVEGLPLSTKQRKGSSGLIHVSDFRKNQRHKITLTPKKPLMVWKCYDKTLWVGCIWYRGAQRFRTGGQRTEPLNIVVSL